MFLRVLIPSWRFFDDVGPAPVLEFRLSPDGTSFGEWIRCLNKIEKRGWKNLFLNSQRNYRFACHSLLEQFVLDLETAHSSNVSRELVENLVRSEISDHAATHFQFRLRLENKDVFLSQIASVHP